MKMRVNAGQEFVIGGYTVGGATFDALVFGYYDRDKLICRAHARWVSYPSTRCDGRGINVAIRPDIVDTSLRCTKVGLIRVNAQSGELLIEHKKTVELALGLDTFDFMPDSQPSASSRTAQA